ncbi:acyl-CoA dehydrogenase family protein [Nocardia gamkensis]|uniref:Acyl-CoA/acyl-ACP dehydrogenase n=2 Tax=Nocardia gamkensis TaxID=352869 RepID=A0A7X6R131_9NOCA|nr:acyl-CoA/acyl-ACP dehydrogenase [Nocardia gamkensis]NQE66644.1 Acyl-CoA dehydrogenase, short-chain specific [Nocardia gamkensis]
MSDEFAEIHDDLRAVARDLLGEADSESAADWSLIARSGWLGLEAPDEFDGAGATFAEVAVVLREVGRAVARGAYPSVAVLAVGALALLERNPQRDELFRGTVAGAVVPVLALAGEQRAGTASSGAVSARADRAPVESPFRLVTGTGGLRLHGCADFVLDAPGADRLLVPARDPGGEIVLAAVESGAPGAVVTTRPVVDATRSLGRVTADDVAVAPVAVWRFRGDGERALRRLYDRAAVAMACDSLGLSEAMLEATVGYAGVREQFGRPIGSFQAVKHACADILVQVTVARQVVAAAVRAEATSAPDAGDVASMAKALSTETAVRVAGKAMQLHGGMGYTWESGIHAYLKRATLDRSLFGTPAEHRKRLARRYASA